MKTPAGVKKTCPSYRGIGYLTVKKHVIVYIKSNIFLITVRFREHLKRGPRIPLGTTKLLRMHAGTLFLGKTIQKLPANNA